MSEERKVRGGRREKKEGIRKKGDIKWEKGEERRKKEERR